MNYYTIYSYRTGYQVGVLLATSFEDAWHKAERRGYNCNDYYIL